MGKDFFDLTGKKAVVTGAGRGLGRSIAVALARYGVDVMLWSRTVSELEQTAALVRAEGRRAWIESVDITEVALTAKMAEKAAESMGRVDVLVNNAGVNKPQPTAEVDEATWDMLMNTNLKGAFFCAQAFGKIMIAQGGGKIINVSSQSGKVALLNRAAYCASKGGVDQITRVMAYEWAEHGVTVNAVAPTFVETEMTANMFKKEEFRDYVFSKLRVPRLAKGEEVAAGVIYLASPGADIVTGHILYIDGGWTIH
ncbi:MAG: SDR family oxidoreductase [Deltaproteobacteria bacterium]|jgi:2-deoxy-D-gluconate 3-dehydrogenase|nr:SDR family oxidoreductase [Deltaproteobacteria bacterium]